MTYVIADSRTWNPDMVANLRRRTGLRFELITTPRDLNLERLQQLRAEKIFLPHWSHLVPEPVFSHFECIVFHMTDLPFGRGGTPLQNLIARGIYDTQISALRCSGQIDAGPIYLKRPLSLQGNAEEVYLRAADVIEEMIVELIETCPEPKPQEGEPTVFGRRTPEQSNVGMLGSLREVYDHIRMLDAPGYPHAFLEVGSFRLEFRRAALTREGILADVLIRKVVK